MNAPDHHFLSIRHNDRSPDALHRRLAHGNRRRLVPAFPTARWEDDLDDEFALRLEEGRFVEEERRSLAEALLQVPHEPAAFMRWFEGLKEMGPGQNDPLFPWLAEEADLAAMRWFVTQEVAGEAGFDDLVALTQLRLPVQAKLELARNYWDEMGRGKRVGMHGPMLEMAVHELALEPSVEATVWESLALGNMMVALAANRRYAWQSVGALGAVEMTAPGRVALVRDGLARLGVSPSGRRYFQLHAGLDVKHSRDWNREVVRPMVEAEPRCARAIAEGALLRLRCGARCFARYRAEFGLG